MSACRANRWPAESRPKGLTPTRLAGAARSRQHRRENTGRGRIDYRSNNTYGTTVTDDLNGDDYVHAIDKCRVRRRATGKTELASCGACDGPRSVAAERGADADRSGRKQGPKGFSSERRTASVSTVREALPDSQPLERRRVRASDAQRTVMLLRLEVLSELRSRPILRLALCAIPCFGHTLGPPLPRDLKELAESMLHLGEEGEEDADELEEVEDERRGPDPKRDRIDGDARARACTAAWCCSTAYSSSAPCDEMGSRSE